jgi:acetyltransferase-like isoleucine patch superfamily enzyme
MGETTQKLSCGLEIGNHVDIASEVMIWTSQHDIHSENMATVEEKVTIGDYVFIGPRPLLCLESLLVKARLSRVEQW